MSAHAQSVAVVTQELGTDPDRGLTSDEARERLTTHGPNALPHRTPPGVAQLFLRQFRGPLILVLLAAAAVSLLLQEWTDAGFIIAVLLVNAIIGTVQEHGAAKSAEALQSMLVERARVRRDGRVQTVEARLLVPGDVVLLAPGDRVPADLRLAQGTGVEAEEALLTGESLPVKKSADASVASDASLGDRITMLFAGTLMARGHAVGVVTHTGMQTILGGIAADVLDREPPKPPLIVRMEAFSRKIAIAVLASALLIGVIELSRGRAMTDIFFTAVALAVSAIPEGLPIALTVALSLGAARMARRRVIARTLVAVESLGSCTFVASDKTGTLTQNSLECTRVAMVGQAAGWSINDAAAHSYSDQPAALRRVVEAVTLANDATLTTTASGDVESSGDEVDVALLEMAARLGLTREDAQHTFAVRAALPFEAERAWSAAVYDVSSPTPEAKLHASPAAGTHENAPRASNADRADPGAPELRIAVKGAVERLLPMCTHMQTADGDVPLDAAAVTALVESLAEDGFRVLGVAAGDAQDVLASNNIDPARVSGLTFLGVTGLIDPLRPGAKEAVAACQRAGITVAMVTGDHPVTARAIAAEVGIANAKARVVTGPALREAAAAGDNELDDLVRGCTVFARVEPDQKLAIVHALQHDGHFVAVTGDGANDAPALRAAQIGVAMGKGGTDVARETAGLILTDDNFASIAAGIEEGRVAYANVRKVIFLLVSCGAAEVMLFLLSVGFGTPLPLLPVQLLWLNLVTNGVQDKALAFEPAEGDIMGDPPRSPTEPIFDALMLRRVLLSGAVMAVICFWWFQRQLADGVPIETARNEVLLLMVLFENVQAGNSRSERQSLFRLNPLRNKWLLAGTLAAQLLHIGAMHVPFFADLLSAAPVTLDVWTTLLGLALILFVVSEADKWWARRRQPVTGP